MKRFLREHPAIVWSGLIVGMALAVFVLVWFQPQKLFIEETVTEAAPGALAPEATSDGSTTEKRAEASAEVLVQGDFSSLEHRTTGTVKIIELPNGQRFLRFEDLDTSNGPDLRVYLSEVPESDDWYAYGEGFVDLGALKGNRGDQNYEIPRDVDLSRYESAVIWCRRFTVGFGVAGLS